MSFPRQEVGQQLCPGATSLQRVSQDGQRLEVILPGDPLRHLSQFPVPQAELGSSHFPLRFLARVLFVT